MITIICDGCGKKVGTGVFKRYFDIEDVPIGSLDVAEAKDGEILFSTLLVNVDKCIVACSDECRAKLSLEVSALS
jgi:hypothetical protein